MDANTNIFIAINIAIPASIMLLWSILFIIEYVIKPHQSFSEGLRKYSEDCER